MLPSALYGLKRMRDSDRNQKFREALRRRSFACGEVILQPKLQHAPLRRVAVKIECLKFQLGENAEQLGFLFPAEEFWLI